ncbi:FadR/GntR family transcriptional regulator [Labrenzia sp. PHM005]|uniref:FadR/GntR family transcriptional regulator n=1 Tax=Labrenzia sp. PHM005 TaxID=2590016 RepID=UPI001140434D|nr:FadR/GntR family transcriptional regulator [Labrenzia sp. PHM005]QDG76322.1 FadR family transcriptional regulator [Labrenzia sp. PHM005]
MFTRTPVPQSIARKLQEMILSGDLKSGEKIPSQRELSEKFGISRASLREALLTLETIGLIKTEAGRGTFVVGAGVSRAMSEWKFSDEHSLREVFETRLVLEGEVAGYAAGHVSGDDLKHLLDLTNKMEQAWSDRDFLSNVDADLEFHDLIARKCQNRLIARLYDQVRELVTETQRQPIPITDPARMRASLSEHRAIVEALGSEDAEASRAAMRKHIANTASCAGFDIG